MAITHSMLSQAVLAEDGEEELRRLCSLGADLLQVHPDGWNLLHIAALVTCSASPEFARTMRFLVERGVDVNARARTQYGSGWTPLHIAAFESEPEVVSTLVELGADVHLRTDDDMTPLALAIDSASMESIRALLRSGASRENVACGASALERARGRVAIFEEALAREDLGGATSKRALEETIAGAVEVVTYLAGLDA